MRTLSPDPVTRLTGLLLCRRMVGKSLLEGTDPLKWRDLVAKHEASFTEEDVKIVTDAARDQLDLALANRATFRGLRETNPSDPRVLMGEDFWQRSVDAAFNRLQFIFMFLT